MLYASFLPALVTSILTSPVVLMVTSLPARRPLQLEASIAVLLGVAQVMPTEAFSEMVIFSFAKMPYALSKPCVPLCVISMVTLASPVIVTLPVV